MTLLDETQCSLQFIILIYFKRQFQSLLLARLGKTGTINVNFMTFIIFDINWNRFLPLLTEIEPPRKCDLSEGHNLFPFVFDTVLARELQSSAIPTEVLSCFTYV